MNQQAPDFLGRIRSLVETFGPGVLLAIIILGLVVAFIVFRKGTGLVFFLLFCSYAIGLIQVGGVIYIATIVRWGCIFLLVLGIFRKFTIPDGSYFFFLAYAILCFSCAFRSPFPILSIQLGALLLLVVISTPIAARGYLVSYDKIDNLFKMGIFAATIWSLSVMALGREFIYSPELRLSAGASIGSFAFSGAYFAPMVLWGFFQKKYKFWRLLSIVLIAPFTALLFLTGARTALFSLIVIASTPMFFLRGKRVTTIFVFLFLSILILLGLSAFSTMAPDKFAFLVGRIMSSETSGRTYLWARGLEWCIDRSMLLGMGVGAAAASFLEFGFFHNAYLIIWYNAGFMGLILVLCFLLIYAVRSFRLIVTSNSTETGDYARIAFGYLIAIIALAMFEGSIAGAADISVFMLMLITSLIDAIKMLQTRDTYNPDIYLESSYSYE